MENKNYKILLVDDEDDILEFLSYNLEKEGYQVFMASDGKSAILEAQKCNPDLIILDIMMPEFDGVEVCRKLRALPEFQHTLIAFLTARNEEYSHLAGFDVGADDYITKPIRPRVFSSRVAALLRRAKRSEVDTSVVIKVADLEVDREQFLVKRDDKEIILAKKEFELLELLATKPGKVFTREEIFQKVWGADVIVGNRTIDVHIRKLREKIGSEYIKTVKGIGYKFEF